MASLFQRDRSPFWWIQWRDPETGKTVRQSTKFRVGVGADFKSAQQMRAELAVKELKTAGRRNKDRWDEWVNPFLAFRYAHSGGAWRYESAWLRLKIYLDSIGVQSPGEIRRHHCQGYMAWRTQGCREKGVKAAGHNTARMELIVLSVVLKEAVVRGYIPANPAAQLGVRRKTPKPKPEMTDEEIAKIRAAIAKENDPSAKHDWRHILQVTFEIALRQGCRLSETYLDVWRDVDIEQGAIQFHAKGDQYYQTELNPALIPLFQRLRAEGRQMTYDPPDQKTQISLRWNKVLKKIGLPHLCFHCTRVTFVSRLERAGAPESHVMRLVNHASTTVHRVYRRLKKAEMGSFWPALGPAAPEIPAEGGPSSDTPTSSESPDAPPATPPPTGPSSASHA